MTLGVVGEGGAAWVVPVSTIFTCAIIYGVLIKGATGIERASKVLFLFIIGVGIWMIYILVTHQSDAIAAAKPAYVCKQFTL